MKEGTDLSHGDFERIKKLDIINIAADGRGK